ncbi:MAG: DUF5654 family protein [bacterium]|nr:DUF5654 family protein [bacterium]
MIHTVRERIQRESKVLRQEVRERTVGYVIAALGLVAGLAWNDAMKGLIEVVFPGDSNTLQAKFLYAALVTLVVVLITAYLVRLFRKEEQ